MITLTFSQKLEGQKIGLACPKSVCFLEPQKVVLNKGYVFDIIISSKRRTS